MQRGKQEFLITGLESEHHQKAQGHARAAPAMPDQLPIVLNWVDAGIEWFLLPGLPGAAVQMMQK